MDPTSILFLGLMLMLGAVIRELRLIRAHIGGHLAMLPWRED